MKTSELLDILRNLVAIPSTYGNEHVISSWIKDYLQDNGYNPYSVEVPESGPNIVSEYIVDKNLPFLLLNGHMDTVEEMKGWTFNPYGELVGNKYYGIGSYDMKSGLALLLATMKSISSGAVKPKLNILFTAVSDEELWSRGTTTLIEEDIVNDQRIKYALVAESQGLGNIVIGRRGRLIFEIIVHGKSAHAATPEKGINAINEVVKVVQSLENIKLGYMKEYNCKGSSCLLAIEGKSISLSVPETVKLELDRHYTPNYTPAKVIEDIKESIKNANLNKDTTIAIKIKKRPSPAPEAYITDPNNNLVQIAVEEMEKIGKVEPKLLIGRSVADSNQIGKLGIPIIDLGPSGKNEHKANEYVDVDTLETYYKIYSNIIQKTR